jgi:hypothetical protein
MKKLSIPIFLIIILFSSCKSTKPVSDSKPVSKPEAGVTDAAKAEINFHDQTTWILGYFKPVRLTSYPYSTWYQKGYDDYQIKSDVLNKLLDINKDDISIKVVMGVWCPDSRREVPRFMRILDVWHFPESRLVFIGVDDAKQSPVGEYTGLKIERVPTFILYKNNIEAGRIIENPVTSLEQDMVNILTGMNNNK